MFLHLCINQNVSICFGPTQTPRAYPGDKKRPFLLFQSLLGCNVCELPQKAQEELNIVFIVITFDIFSAFLPNPDPDPTMEATINALLSSNLCFSRFFGVLFGQRRSIYIGTLVCPALLCSTELAANAGVATANTVGMSSHL